LTGATGATGSAGIDGKTVLNGTIAPSSSDGSLGDFYLNTATSSIYGPKTALGWGTATSLVGPAGPSYDTILYITNGNASGVSTTWNIQNTTWNLFTCTIYVPTNTATLGVACDCQYSLGSSYTGPYGRLAPGYSLNIIYQIDGVGIASDSKQFAARTSGGSVGGNDSFSSTITASINSLNITPGFHQFTVAVTISNYGDSNNWVSSIGNGAVKLCIINKH
jgi:hypothetical protein